MCYQESRWHAICNHTIQSKVECSKQCSKYGAIDTVETQLTAYCHACRRHVDSLGVAAHYRNASNRLSRTRSRRSSNLPLASPSSVENLRATAGSPAPSIRSLSRASSVRTISGSSLSKRLTSTASTGDLRGEMALGRQASMGTIMSVFMQEQQKNEQEMEDEDVKVFMNVDDVVPEVMSPIPQKPQLSVRIPEETVFHLASPTSATAKSTTSEVSRSSQATRSPGAESKSLRLASAQHASSTAPTTPKTPSRSSLSASLEDRPSKPPTDPLPSLPLLPSHSPKPSTFGSTLSDLRKSLRRTKSSSRLLGGQLPYFLQHKNAPIDPIPSPPLRKSKSSRTLGSDTSSNTTVSSLRADRDWSGTPPPPPTMMARPRPVAPAGNPFKPVIKKDLIDIHDPEWLGKHGLKWDAHGLGVVSAAV